MPIAAIAFVSSSTCFFISCIGLLGDSLTTATAMLLGPLSAALSAQTVNLSRLTSSSTDKSFCILVGSLCNYNVRMLSVTFAPAKIRIFLSNTEGVLFSNSILSNNFFSCLLKEFENLSINIDLSFSYLSELGSCSKMSTTASMVCSSRWQTMALNLSSKRTRYAVISLSRDVNHNFGRFRQNIDSFISIVS